MQGHSNQIWGKGHRSGRVARWIAATAGAMAMSCGGEVDTGSGSPSPGVVVGDYDPTDVVHPTTIDLVVQPGADVAILGVLEIQIVAGPIADDRGRQIITIRSTGRLAASLAQYGLVAEGHRSLLPSSPTQPGVGIVAQETTVKCGAWAKNKCTFPWFDADPAACAGGIKTELLAMASTPNVNVKTIGMSVEDRNVIAVRVGPRNPAAESAVTPTVYVLGGHHAKEWTSVEVPLRLARLFIQCLNSGSAPCFDSQVYDLLRDRAVVFVPVSNPDGYQYSRCAGICTAGDRDQRKNRRPNCTDPLNHGVDINRNYRIGWGMASCDSCSTTACDGTFIGPAAESEPETVALEKLLRGKAFENAAGTLGRQSAAATITYHTYSDVVVYPEGWKGADDLAGKKCDSDDNCTNPDFMVNRRLFGDTEFPIFFDSTYNPAFQAPSGTGNNLIYTVTGDATMYANYNAVSTTSNSIAVTPELQSQFVNFYAECEPNPDALIAPIVTEQRGLVKRLLANSTELVATSSGYAPANLGTYPPGLFTREFPTGSGLTSDTVRATWTKNRWLPVDISAPLQSQVDGVTFNMNRGRKGDQYSLYSLPAQSMTGNPLCLPCKIQTIGESGLVSKDGANCERCQDMCDPNRLPHSNWNLVVGPRPAGGQTDCWWTPTASSTDAILTIPVWQNPRWTDGTQASHCHLTFSWEWRGDPFSTEQVVLERRDGSTWKELTRWAFGLGNHPTLEFRTARRVRSEIFETNGGLPGATKEFRFRVPANTSQPADFKLFDPVVYCRFGSVP